MSCAGTELTRTSEVVTGAACLTEVQLLKVLCAYVSLLLSHSLHNTTRSRSVCCLARFPSRAFFRGHRFQFLENLSKVFEFPCGVSYTGFQIVKKSRLSWGSSDQSPQVLRFPQLLSVVGSLLTLPPLAFGTTAPNLARLIMLLGNVSIVLVLSLNLPSFCLLGMVGL